MAAILARFCEPLKTVILLCVYKESQKLKKEDARGFKIKGGASFARNLKRTLAFAVEQRALPIIFTPLYPYGVPLARNIVNNKLYQKKAVAWERCSLQERELTNEKPYLSFRVPEWNATLYVKF